MTFRRDKLPRVQFRSCPNDPKRSGFGRVRFLFRRVGGFLHEGRDPIQFLFETGHEVARAIFKEDHEAEGEKHKQQRPEQSADETHARTLTYSLSAVNDLVRNIRQKLPLMLR